MGVEVSKHVKHRLEPQVLDMTLAVTVQRKAEVLWAQMGRVSAGERASCLLGKYLWGLLEI